MDPKLRVTCARLHHAIAVPGDGGVRHSLVAGRDLLLEVDGHWLVVRTPAGSVVRTPLSNVVSVQLEVDEVRP